ncbi:MAG: hypothetical protein R3Y27_04015 [Clostridia bacterium]
MQDKVFYTVIDIRGDYCILKSDSGIENPVAMFFMPDEVAVGCKIVYENFEYTIL